MIDFDTLLYLFKVSIIMSFLYGLYHFTLRKETFFSINRIFLLCIAVISFIIPAITVNSDVISDVNLWVDELSTHTIMVEGKQDVIQETNAGNKWSVVYLLSLIYTVGAGLYCLYLALQLLRLVYKISKGRKVTVLGCKVIVINDSEDAFAFMRSVVIGDRLLSDPHLDTIIHHENIHTSYHHYIDCWLSELLCAVFWFNPFVYKYKKSLTEVNEYFTDNLIASSGKDECIRYMNVLVYYASTNYNQLPLINSYNTLIKRRLLMISKKKSASLSKAKLLFAVPVIVVMFALFSGKNLVSAEISSLPIRNAFLNSFPESSLTADGIPDGLPLKEGSYRISAKFGPRENPIDKKSVPHSGIDLAAPLGTPIYATGDGEVIKVGERKKKGVYVEIQHSDGYKTYYWHLEKYDVKKGQKVKKGDVIATVGETGLATGPHLHYMVIKNGKLTDPEKVWKK
ncbi:MAG: peptidoglycan DD-metalloendopeptidase family protein [Hyphomicrobiales bacterium]